jgi:GNAT superfamily N-acetyltransferase
MIYTQDKTPERIVNEIILHLVHIKPLNSNNYHSIYNFLQNNLHLSRTEDFLKEKLQEYPQYFKGLYLDDELIGVIQGFPRDDYILISEIAVDRRFRRKGYGTLLIKAFETEVQHKEIKVGAQDEAIQFYLSLGYKPSIYVQLKKDSWPPKNFIVKQEFEDIVGYEIAVDKIDLDLLEDWKSKAISAQYLFTKSL